MFAFLLLSSDSPLYLGDSPPAVFPANRCCFLIRLTLSHAEHEVFILVQSSISISSLLDHGYDAVSKNHHQTHLGFLLCHLLETHMLLTLS